MIAALLAVQIGVATAPARAADLAAAEGMRTGMFGGLQVRVPLDGVSRRRPVRAGLALAPTLHSRSQIGEPRTRSGQGLEFGLAGNGGPGLSLVGMRLDRLGAAQGEMEEVEDGGISALAIVGIGAAVLVGATLGAFQLCADGEICGSDRDD